MYTIKIQYNCIKENKVGWVSDYDGMPETYKDHEVAATRVRYLDNCKYVLDHNEYARPDYIILPLSRARKLKSWTGRR